MLSKQETACLTEEDCAAAARSKGMDFTSGAFPTSGCFSKRNKVSNPNVLVVSRIAADVGAHPPPRARCSSPPAPRTP